MALKNKMEEVTKKHGKPIEEVLIEAFKEHGTQAAVARALGVSPATIERWILLCGLVKRTTIEERYEYRVKS